MVLIDTSVWIRLFRKQDAGVSRRLSILVNQNQAAICGPVWVEFIGGFRSDALRRQYAELMAEYPWLDTPRHAFELAAEWAARHRRLGAGDAVIAATAYIHEASLLTADRAIAQLSHEGLHVERVV